MDAGEPTRTMRSEGRVTFRRDNRRSTDPASGPERTMITKEVSKKGYCLPTYRKVRKLYSLHPPFDSRQKNRRKRLAVVVLAHFWPTFVIFLACSHKIRPLRGRWALLLAVVS